MINLTEGTYFVRRPLCEADRIVGRIWYVNSFNIKVLLICDVCDIITICYSI